MLSWSSSAYIASSKQPLKSLLVKNGSLMPEYQKAVTHGIKSTESDPRPCSLMSFQGKSPLNVTPMCHLASSSASGLGVKREAESTHKKFFASSYNLYPCNFHNLFLVLTFGPHRSSPLQESALHI